MYFSSPCPVSLSLSLSLSQACRLAAAIFDRNDFAALGNPSDAKHVRSI